MVERDQGDVLFRLNRAQYADLLCIAQAHIVACHQFAILIDGNVIHRRDNDIILINLRPGFHPPVNGDVIARIHEDIFLLRDHVSIGVNVVSRIEFDIGHGINHAVIHDIIGTDHHAFDHIVKVRQCAPDFRARSNRKVIGG